IVEPSSAAVVPALLGIPVLLAQYGRLGAQRYGEVLTSYPRARNLTDIGSVASLLGSERAELDSDRTRDWIACNAGPLPATQMPERVADVVEAIIQQKRGRSEGDTRS